MKSCFIFLAGIRMSMLRTALCLSAGFLASGCGVFRSVTRAKTDSIFTQKERQLSQTQSAEDKLEQIAFSYTDSGKYRQQLLIIPEGDFVFSPREGFKGKAKSLLVSGIQESRQQMDFSSLQAQRGRLDSGSMQIYQSSKRIRSADRSRESRIPFKEFIVAALLVLLLGTLLWKLFKFR